MLLTLSFFLIVFLINLLSLKKMSFWKTTLTKGFCVKGDWLDIGFNKILWYDPWKKKFFQISIFLSLI